MRIPDHQASRGISAHNTPSHYKASFYTGQVLPMSSADEMLLYAVYGKVEKRLLSF
ncbi:MAG: hypothetical protein OXM61_23490 [Candidatus Poribacteria bacterium]|nr:hypothetical protein [Candidatus Poribacteria bacterium]